MDEIINKYCVIRGDKSGVFAGIVVKVEGQQVELKNVRRIWRWDGACSISELAVNGTKRPDNCKFTVVVKKLILTDVIEIIPTTKEAEKSIKGVEEWKY